MSVLLSCLNLNLLTEYAWVILALETETNPGLIIDVWNLIVTMKSTIKSRTDQQKHVDSKQHVMTSFQSKSIKEYNHGTLNTNYVKNVAFSWKKRRNKTKTKTKRNKNLFFFVKDTIIEVLFILWDIMSQKALSTIISTCLFRGEYLLEARYVWNVFCLKKMMGIRTSTRT